MHPEEEMPNGSGSDPKIYYEDFSRSNQRIYYESSTGNLLSLELDENRNQKPSNAQDSLAQNMASGVVALPNSSKSSTTQKIVDWDIVSKPMDTETAEFQKNEQECQKLMELEQNNKYTSALNNAVQQIKFEQSRSNRLSVHEKDASPDGLLNKNLLKICRE